MTSDNESLREQHIKHEVRNAIVHLRWAYNRIEELSREQQQVSTEMNDIMIMLCHITTRLERVLSDKRIDA